MPDEQPPADAGTDPNTPGGVTPPATETPSAADTEASIRAALRASNTAEPVAVDKDPLLAGDTDPLFDDDTLGNDPFHPGQEPEKPADAGNEDKPPTNEAPAKTEEPGSPSGRKRLNIFRKDAQGNYIHSDLERAAMTLSDEEGISVMAALERLTGKPIAPKADAPGADDKPDPDQESQQTLDPIEEIQAKLKENAKAKARAFEDLAYDRLAELDEERDALRDQLSELKHQQQSQQSEQQTAYAQAEAESMTRAAAAFPESGQAGTPLHDAIAADVARLEKINPAFFADPDWPETLAAKHAHRLGVARRGTAPAAPAATPKKVARAITPAPAAGGNGQAAPAQSSELQFRQRLDAAKARGDIDAVRAMLREQRIAA